MKIDPGKDFGRRECPSCAIEVAANHNQCPICGYEFPHPGPTRKQVRFWAALILLGLFLFLVLNGLL